MEAVKQKTNKVKQSPIKKEKKEIKVIHIRKDGTIQDSMEGVTIPKEIVSQIYDRLGWN